MSNNQPGPYGGQPQQSGPYGSPGPYGQAPQPGYGYPPQGVPPQGVPPQANPYAQPTQPMGQFQAPQAPYGQPPYGQAPYGVPPMQQPPVPAPAKKKRAGLIVGIAAVVVAVAVGAYVVGGNGGGGGLENDGAHRLDTPAKVVTDYKRVGKGGETDDADTVKYLQMSGVKGGKAVVGQWSTADFGDDFDPRKPDPAKLPPQAELLTARGVTMLGGYGEIADPEATLDMYFAAITARIEANNKKIESGGSAPGASKTTLEGQPEKADIDGAAAKCQAASSVNSLTKKVATDWFCVWADYSTVAMVSPGDNTKSVDKATAIDITTKLRKEARVKV